MSEQGAEHIHGVKIVYADIVSVEPALDRLGWVIAGLTVVGIISILAYPYTFAETILRAPAMFAFGIVLLALFGVGVRIRLLDGSSLFLRKPFLIGLLDTLVRLKVQVELSKHKDASSLQ